MKYKVILIGADVDPLRWTVATITDDASVRSFVELPTLSYMVGLSTINILSDTIPAKD